MSLAAEKQMEHIGETCPCQDSIHDLTQVFTNRTNSVWRYDQYIANAEGNRELQDFWRELKKQDQRSCDRMKELLAEQLQIESTKQGKCSVR